MTRAAAIVALVAALAAPAAAAPRAHTALREVRACVALDDGRILAGTDGGLALYEGDDLAVVLTALDGLPGTRVHSLLRDDDGGVIWVGTEAGLARLERRGRELRLAATVAADAPLRALARHDGALYAASFGDGLLRLDGDRLSRLGPALRATSLAVLEGTLYVGTATGLYRLAGGALEEVPAALPSDLVWALLAHEGRLYAGTASGLAALDGATFGGALDVRALASGADGVRVGTFGDGVLDLVDGRLVAAASADARHVNALGEGCVAARDALLVRAGNDGWRRAAAPGLPSNDVSALAVDGDRVWAGTFDQGLAVLEDGVWRAVADPLIDPRVNAIAVERRRRGGSRIWVATARGLVLVHGEKVRRYTDADGLPSSEILSVAALRGGGVAAGTKRGVALLRDGEVTVLAGKQGLPVRAVWAIAEAPDGALWVGTIRGVYRRSKKGRVQRFSTASGHLADDWVTALAVDAGAVYVGTYRGGVARLVYGRRETSATDLGGGLVNPGGLAVAGGRLHAATMDGLLVRAADGSDAWQRVDAAPGRDVTAVVPVAGALWVASRRGIARA